MKNSRMVFSGLSFAFLPIALTLMSGCAKKDDVTPVSIAQVSPIVKASLPAGLKPGATPTISSLELELARAEANLRTVTTYTPTANVMPTAFPANNSDQFVLAQIYIQNLFQNKYAGDSGGTTQGYIMSLVNQVDGRMGIVNGQDSKGHTCLSATPSPVTADFTNISPVLTLTMPNLQCSAAFESGAVATMAAGAGEAFGISADGKSASVWTSMLTTTNNTINDFIDFANITNSGTAVDGMSFTYSQNNVEFTATRYKADQTAHTFEMYYASNTGFLMPISGGPSILGAGFRMVSDGTYIYAEGLLSREPGTTPSSGTLASNNWYPFTVCLNGSDLTVDDTMTHCQNAYNAFSLATSAVLDYNHITGLSVALDSIPLSAAVGMATTPSTTATGDLATKSPITVTGATTF